MNREWKTGTLERFVDILSAVVRGQVLDRQTIAKTWGMTVAAADRYIRAMNQVPGVVLVKQGRRLLVRWSHTDAIKAAGL